MSSEYRYFKLYKLNNEVIQFGRVKIPSNSGKPLDASKKLLSSIFKYMGLTEENKLKSKIKFYIKETTKDSNKNIYGPYKVSFKKSNKSVIVKLVDGSKIKHTNNTSVLKNKNKKMIIQKGGLQQLTIEVDINAVTSILQLSNGNLITGDFNGEIIISDTNIGIPIIRKYRIHNNPIRCIIQLLDGRVIYASYSRLIIIDQNTGDYLMTLNGHTQFINCIIQVLDGRIISGSSDNTLKIWDKDTGICLMTLLGHTEYIACVIQLLDERIVSGSGDGTLKIWNKDTGICLFTLSGHQGLVNCVLELPNNLIVSGTDDSTLKIWDVDTGICINTLTGHTRAINCLLNIGNCFASGGEDRTIKLWNLYSFDCIGTLNNRGTISNLIKLSDNKIASNSGPRINIWTFNEGEHIILNGELSNIVHWTNSGYSSSVPVPRVNLSKLDFRIISNYDLFYDYIKQNYFIGETNNGIEQFSFNAYTEFDKLFPIAIKNNYDFGKFLNYIILFIKSLNYDIYMSRRETILKYYVQFISIYLYRLKDVYDKIFYHVTIFELNIEKDKELNNLYNILKIIKNRKMLLNKGLQIKYIGEQGINLGGLKRQFLTNLENQLNENGDFDVDTVLYCLAISKFNNNLINLKNKKYKDLKEKIIENIIVQFPNNIKKNIAKNLLENNIDVNGILLLGINSENITRSTINNNSKNFNNRNTNQNILSFLSNSKKVNNIIKKRYIENKNSLMFDYNTNYSSISLIDYFIEKEIYLNYLDFYVSHFLNSSINVDTLNSKLKFRYTRNTENQDKFEKLFKNLLRSLNDDELKLFNIAISASTHIQHEYIINITDYYTNNNFRYPVYHSCFVTMDIDSSNSFLKHFLCTDSDNEITDTCKNKFVETLHTTLGEGFQLS